MNKMNTADAGLMVADMHKEEAGTIGPLSVRLLRTTVMKRSRARRVVSNKPSGIHSLHEHQAPSWVAAMNRQASVVVTEIDNQGNLQSVQYAPNAGL